MSAVQHVLERESYAGKAQTTEAVVVEREWPTVPALDLNAGTV
jgi:hypothetical protein